MKTILVPIDFSTATRFVLGAARSLALSLEGRVILLHVVQPPVLTSDYGAGITLLSDVALMSEKVAARKLAQLEAEYKTSVPSLETVQLTGGSVAGILEQAQKLGADYIVMGSHGHTAFYDLLVGSTTHGVLKRAKCPVLVVPVALMKKPAKRRKRA